MSHWLNWNEINHAIANKRVVFYGRSEDWVPKTLKMLCKKPEYIVDRTLQYQGSLYKNIAVKAPDVLKTEDKKSLFIIITSGSYESITPYLNDLGFQAGIHYSCCPDYYDLSILDHIRSYDRDLLISSSDYNDSQRARSSQGGGGLYRYNTLSMEKERLVEGSFRQVVNDSRGYFYAIEYVAQKLFILDSDLNVVETMPLDAPNYCGIALSEKHNCLVLINASQDSITFLDKDNLQQIQRIYYSNKCNGGYESHHHLNDVCISDDSIYVSFFSHSGNWHKSIYDGGLSEFSFTDLEKGPTQLMFNLWNPHSPQIIDGDLAILDSMRGNLLIGNQKIEGQFNGFSRGLASDGRYYFIGQSESMYSSRLAGISKNLMLNAGFYLFDNKMKVSRFFSLPEHMNVHDIVCLND